MNTVSDSSAADHALGYNGIYGGFVSKSITVAQKTHVHYDETLRTAGTGQQLPDRQLVRGPREP